MPDEDKPAIQIRNNNLVIPLALVASMGGTIFGGVWKTAKLTEQISDNDATIVELKSEISTLHTEHRNDTDRQRLSSIETKLTYMQKSIDSMATDSRELSMVERLRGILEERKPEAPAPPE